MGTQHTGGSSGVGTPGGGHCEEDLTQTGPGATTGQAREWPAQRDSVSRVSSAPRAIDATATTLATGENTCRVLVKGERFARRFAAFSSASSRSEPSQGKLSRRRETRQRTKSDCDPATDSVLHPRSRPPSATFKVGAKSFQGLI